MNKLSGALLFFNFFLFNSSLFSQHTEIEPNNNFFTANLVQIGDTTEALTDTVGDVDYFKFTANAGDTVQFNVNGTTNGGIFTFYDPDSSKIEWYNFTVMMTPYIIPVSGSYFIKVEGFNTGNYRFILRYYEPGAPYFWYENAEALFYNQVYLAVASFPNGLDTHISVEYGLTESLGQVYNLPDPVNSIFPVRSFVKLTDIIPNSLYSYRAKVENSVGVSYGPIQHFPVPEVPEYWQIKNPDSLVFSDTSKPSFADENTGCIFRGTTLQKTNDGGNTWSSITIPYDISKGACLDSLTYIGGSYNSLYRSTDGGYTWLLPESGNQTSPIDIAFYDKLNGAAVGGSGIIVHTSDGGKNWTQCQTNTTNKLWAVTFYNKNGWAVGQNGTVLKTIDGGLTWNNVQVSNSEYFQDVCFADSLTGYIADYTDVWKTTNAGSSWFRLPHIGSYVNDLSFINKDRGIAVVNYYIILTTDGGLTWTPQASGTYNMLQRAARNGGDWIVTGSYNTILKSTYHYTKIEDDRNNPVPLTFSLAQNYPNPFNPSTIISYSIPQKSYTSIKVYDILGKEITVLVNEEKPAGTHQVEFNASGLSSGVYIYRINAGGRTASKKLMLLK